MISQPENLTFCASSTHLFLQDCFSYSYLWPLASHWLTYFQHAWSKIISEHWMLKITEKGLYNTIFCYTPIYPFPSLFKDSFNKSVFQKEVQFLMVLCKIKDLPLQTGRILHLKEVKYQSESKISSQRLRWDHSQSKPLVKLRGLRQE